MAHRHFDPSINPDRLDYTGTVSDAAARALGIDRDIAGDLFVPVPNDTPRNHLSSIPPLNVYEATADQAIRCLQILATQGRVDWATAMTENSP